VNAPEAAGNLANDHWIADLEIVELGELDHPGVGDAAADGLWPVRYSADELAAFRWLLASDPTMGVPADATDPLADSFDVVTDPGDAIAIGIVELEETGKIELDPAADRVTILPPHDLIVMAARTGAQTVVRHATPESADAYVFVISPLLADEQVGLELWRRNDGSMWVNTWQLEEMAVRIVEHLDLPPASDERNSNRDIRHIDLDTITTAFDDPTSPFGGLLEQLESYTTVELLVAQEDSLAMADLRVLVTSTGVWVVEDDETPDDATDLTTVTLVATDSADVIHRLDAMFDVV
jgi:hypothetical protein